MFSGADVARWREAPTVASTTYGTTRLPAGDAGRLRNDKVNLDKADLRVCWLNARRIAVTETKNAANTIGTSLPVAGRVVGPAVAMELATR